MNVKVAIAVLLVVFAVLPSDSRRSARRAAMTMPMMNMSMPMMNMSMPMCSMDGPFLSSTGRRFICVENHESYNYLCNCVGNCAGGIINVAGYKMPKASVPTYTYYRQNFSDLTPAGSIYDEITCNGTSRMFKGLSGVYSVWNAGFNKTM